MKTNDQKYNELSSRVKDKTNELKATQNKLDQTVSQLVEGKASERETTSAKHVELTNLINILQNELKELTRRRDVALIASYELNLSQAEDELDRLAEIVNNIKVKVDQKDKEVLHTINKPGRSTETKDNAMKIIEVKAEQAKAMAEYRLARMDTDKQKEAVRVARVELEEALKSIQK
jgi:chromosome segregation ATPase